jgi:parvulin-like peptidyl-prolyl isomerase
MSELPYSEQEIICQLKISGQMPALLEGIANRNIILEAAKANGIEVDEAEIQQAADQVRLANQLNQAADTWVWLQKQGLTLDDFEEMVHFSVLSTKLAQHLFAEKVEALFAERQIEYIQAALYEILLEDEDLALELYYAINEGELSFLDAAKQYVSDKELGRKGGYRGFVSRMDLQAEVRAAVFATEPPQLLKPRPIQI